MIPPRVSGNHREVEGNSGRQWETDGGTISGDESTHNQAIRKIDEKFPERTARYVNKVCRFGTCPSLTHQ